jgi:hypothetical protein
MSTRHYTFVLQASRFLRATLVVLALALLTGCGANRIPIGGAVTFNGKPVPEGSISFEPADGIGPTTGGAVKAGKYELIGDAAPLPGKKKVRITGVYKTGRQIVAGPPFAPGTMVDEVGGNLPDTYGNQSTLTCEVSRDGSKQIDFNLKSQ